MIIPGKKIKPLIVFLFMLFTATITNSQELSPFDIIKKVDNRDDGETSISDTIMIKVDRRGQQRKLELKSYRKDDGEDSKSILFFTAPADKRNVSFLSWEKDNEEEEDDKWLYLPAGNIKTRISGGKKKDPFMGSDFSYADMESTDIEDWNYSFTDQYTSKDKSKLNPVVNGNDCWIIQALPKKEKLKKIITEIGYLKRVIWVRKDNFMMVQGRTWVKKGKKTKLFFARKIKKIQGIWTAQELEMRTYKGSITTKKRRARSLQHRTILLFKDMQYNKPLEDAMFTVQRMMRGL
jgi:hypothetical protein